LIDFRTPPPATVNQLALASVKFRQMIWSNLSSSGSLVNAASQNWLGLTSDSMTIPEMSKIYYEHIGTWGPEIVRLRNEAQKRQFPEVKVTPVAPAAPASPVLVVPAAPAKPGGSAPVPPVLVVPAAPASPGVSASWRPAGRPGSWLPKGAR